MADNEIMKDAELDAVVGGSGIECMGLMARLQNEGLAKFKTPLVAGNEAAAAKELSDFLQSVKNRHGGAVFQGAKIYSDGRINFYGGYSATEINGHLEWHPTTADEAFSIIKSWKEEGW